MMKCFCATLVHYTTLSSLNLSYLLTGQQQGYPSEMFWHNSSNNTVIYNTDTSSNRKLKYFCEDIFFFELRHLVWFNNRTSTRWQTTHGRSTIRSLLRSNIIHEEIWLSSRHRYGNRDGIYKCLANC